MWFKERSCFPSLPVLFQHSSWNKLLGESVSVVSGCSHRGRWLFIQVLEGIPVLGRMLEEVISKMWFFSSVSTFLSLSVAQTFNNFGIQTKGKRWLSLRLFWRQFISTQAALQSHKSHHQPQLILGKMNFISLSSCLFIIHPCFKEALGDCNANWTKNEC